MKADQRLAVAERLKVDDVQVGRGSRCGLARGQVDGCMNGAVVSTGARLTESEVSGRQGGRAAWAECGSRRGSWGAAVGAAGSDAVSQFSGARVARD